MKTSTLWFLLALTVLVSAKPNRGFRYMEPYNDGDPPKTCSQPWNSVITIHWIAGVGVLVSDGKFKTGSVGTPPVDEKTFVAYYWDKGQQSKTYTGKYHLRNAFILCDRAQSKYNWISIKSVEDWMKALLDKQLVRAGALENKPEVRTYIAKLTTGEMVMTRAWFNDLTPVALGPDSLVADFLLLVIE